MLKKQEDGKPKEPEKTEDQIYWDEAAKKGYLSFQIVAKSEDLHNPNQDYVTIGWKDANGLPIPAQTATKEAWITTAKYILAKYDNSGK